MEWAGLRIFPILKGREDPIYGRNGSFERSADFNINICLEPRFSLPNKTKSMSINDIVRDSLSSLNSQYGLLDLKQRNFNPVIRDSRLETE